MMISPHVDVDILQVPQKPQSQQKPQQAKGKQKVIDIVFSKELFTRAGSDVKILKDSVIFFHDGAYLYWNRVIPFFSMATICIMMEIQEL